ncbi:RNA polymerase sigma-54 factor [invertebrate metagenome]|uniref:RNA polymerase sigma-54 factor n=1 Tax=invertebrate metagenome TaxID=1711999 RepID=A0A2H9TCD6_9ZZZZ
MKPFLQLKASHQLTMTPQLQQAIRLLQLSSLELQQEIREALDSNPMLEQDDGQPEDASAPNTHANSLESDRVSLPETDKNDSAESSDTKENEEQWQECIPSELPVDSRWEDIYSGLSTPTDGQDFFCRQPATDNLQDHLEWQLNLSGMKRRERMIGLSLIESIAPSGYLSSSLSDICQLLSTELKNVTLEEIRTVKRHIQHLDPTGCGSENLKDCLLSQLELLPESTPNHCHACEIIHHHLDDLGCHDYARIIKATRFQETQVKNALSLIKTLNPCPGSAFHYEAPPYVIPDLIIKKQGRSWTADLCNHVVPRLRINKYYASLVKRGDNSRDTSFIRNNLHEAQYFIKNLKNRNNTLLRVAQQIVKVQQDFLNHGDEAMKPLILSDIALATDLHESTISRVTSQKYIQTPRGVFELKYFFSSHVGNSDGKEYSSTAIRALIRKLISEENCRRPLSDNKIVSLLNQQGVKVARRTIAKYRESMKIPPSNERKQLA